MDKKRIARELRTLAGELNTLKKATEEKVIFQALADLLSSTGGGLSIMPKDVYEEKKVEYADDDDLAQVFYDGGMTAHFDIDMPDQFEMADTGKDVLIEFENHTTGATEKVKLSEVIQKLASGDWLIFEGNTTPEDSHPLIAKLKAVQAQL